jgi:hypothetical protein
MTASRRHVAARRRLRGIAPGVEHAIGNAGLVDHFFLVAIAPATDDVTQI